jgi:hypothetical protein
MEWREKAAFEMGMAPATVLPEYLAKRICMARCQTTAALQSKGVRIRTIDTLATTMQAAISKLKLTPAPHCQPSGIQRNSSSPDSGSPDSGSQDSGSPDSGSQDSGSQDQEFLVLPSMFKAQDVRPPLVPLTGDAAKKTPNWEVSTNRFAAGESLASIAGTQTSGRPIQVPTVRGHILKGLVAAKVGVELQRLYKESCAANTAVFKTQWDALNAASLAMKPPLKFQGGGSKVDWGFSGDSRFELARLNELLGAVHTTENKDGPELCDLLKVPWTSRSARQKHLYAKWSAAADWWGSLKRANVPVTFAGGSEML